MKVLTFALILAFAALSNAQWVDPNNITNYLTKEGIQRLEASIRISTDLSKVRFYLYTPEHGSENHWIFKAGADPQDLLDHGFDPSRPTKFISHGWTAGAAGWVDNFAAGYFSHPQLYCNIIGVEYTPLATWDNYFLAANNAVRVGKHSGEVIGVDLLMNGLGQTPDQIHAIGHSLGGHVVGHFGRSVKELGGQGQIARVTSLDPAKPWFDFTKPENKINKDDAKLVDVIHTNMGWLWEGSVALWEQLGDLDFYPNGGEHQPGCDEVCVGILCSQFGLWEIFTGGCSHSRAVSYFIESIEESYIGQGFMSKSCDSWNHYADGNCHDHVSPVSMGNGMEYDMEDHQQSLSLFLNVHKETPYSAH